MKKFVCLIGALVLSGGLLIGCGVPVQKDTAAQKQVDPRVEHLQNVYTDQKLLEERKEITDPGYPKEFQTESGTVADAAASETPNQSVILCEICGDDDCNDGIYCDDADELAENLREAETRRNGTPCEICGDYDCDDGIYCDDAHEKHENLAEEKKPTPTEPKPSVTLCEICGDDDCDDGVYCDDADELAENLWEAENRKNGTPCEICGDYDCDDGPYCDDHWDNDDDDDDDDDDHHGHHGRHHKD